MEALQDSPFGLLPRELLEVVVEHAARVFTLGKNVRVVCSDFNKAFLKSCAFVLLGPWQDAALDCWLDGHHYVHANIAILRSCKLLLRLEHLEGPESGKRLVFVLNQIKGAPHRPTPSFLEGFYHVPTMDANSHDYL